MSQQLKLLSAILVVSLVLSILYSVLETEKVKKINTWYHILRGKRNSYDFKATIKRSKLVFYYFTTISALGIILSFVNQKVGEIFVWISFVSLVISLYYLHPVKIDSGTDRNNNNKKK